MLLGRLPDGVGHGGGDDDGSSASHQASLLHPLLQEPLVPVQLATPRAKFSTQNRLGLVYYYLEQFMHFQIIKIFWLNPAPVVEHEQPVARGRGRVVRLLRRVLGENSYMTSSAVGVGTLGGVDETT